MIGNNKEITNQIESKIDLISKGTKTVRTELDSLSNNPIKSSGIDIKNLLSKTSLSFSNFSSSFLFQAFL